MRKKRICLSYISLLSSIFSLSLFFFAFVNKSFHGTSFSFRLKKFLQCFSRWQSSGMDSPSFCFLYIHLHFLRGIIFGDRILGWQVFFFPFSAFKVHRLSSSLHRFWWQIWLILISVTSIPFNSRADTWLSVLSSC